ncbi:MAG: hypothetical protein JWM11_7365, partial [Planctomycetaceae bacterium]|nr:hypothetical protein [Planctomycetaceae bacterium]
LLVFERFRNTELARTSHSNDLARGAQIAPLIYSHPLRDSQSKMFAVQAISSTFQLFGMFHVCHQLASNQVCHQLAKDSKRLIIPHRVHLGGYRAFALLFPRHSITNLWNSGAGVTHRMATK